MPPNRRREPASAKKPNRAPQRSETLPGYPARQLAVELIGAVLLKGRALEDTLQEALGPGGEYSDLPVRDRGFARLIAATALRRLGQLEAALNSFLERPLPRDRGALTPILLAAAAQLLFLGTPPHAVINIAVEQCRRDAGARGFARLANAILRRIAKAGPSLLSRFDIVLNIPEWLRRRWERTYTLPVARQIAAASLCEAPLDLTAKSDPGAWAERLGGRLLPTGSIRVVEGPRVEDLPGYSEGAWWVQDAAAALPARLLGSVAGLRTADLCAAPGGKTAQLATAGAEVIAVDVSDTRLDILRQNLARLGLAAEVVTTDATAWAPGVQFDAVLLDVPCIATGTIRRHPDILRLKRPGDVGKLAALQSKLLDNAIRLLRPGGRLVYSCCSLEPEEGPDQIARALAATPKLARVPIEADELGLPPEAITPEGDLRTFPFHLSAEPPEHGGLDGFYAARLALRR